MVFQLFRRSHFDLCMMVVWSVLYCVQRNPLRINTNGEQCTWFNIQQWAFHHRVHRTRWWNACYRSNWMLEMCQTGTFNLCPARVVFENRLHPQISTAWSHVLEVLISSTIPNLSNLQRYSRNVSRGSRDWNLENCPRNRQCKHTKLETELKKCIVKYLYYVTQ